MGPWPRFYRCIRIGARKCMPHQCLGLYHRALPPTGARCGGTYHGMHTIVFSPGYPGNYSRAGVCEWTISVPDPYKIGLYFDNAGKSTKGSTQSRPFYDDLNYFSFSQTQILRTRHVRGSRKRIPGSPIRSDHRSDPHSLLSLPTDPLGS